jgi:hypothetical protein
MVEFSFDGHIIPFFTAHSIKTVLDMKQMRKITPYYLRLPFKLTSDISPHLSSSSSSSPISPTREPYWLMTIGAPRLAGYGTPEAITNALTGLRYTRTRTLTHKFSERKIRISSPHLRTPQFSLKNIKILFHDLWRPGTHRRPTSLGPRRSCSPSATEASGMLRMRVRLRLRLRLGCFISIFHEVQRRKIGSNICDILFLLLLFQEKCGKHSCSFLVLNAHLLTTV